VRGSGAFCDIERCLFVFVKPGRWLRCPQQCGQVQAAEWWRKPDLDTVLSVKPGCKASGGEIRSENVDMSSDKEGERPSRRKSKGSCLKLI
jgi:hypothetical protein